MYRALKPWADKEEEQQKKLDNLEKRNLQNLGKTALSKTIHDMAISITIRYDRFKLVSTCAILKLSWFYINFNIKKRIVIGTRILPLF